MADIDPKNNRDTFQGRGERIKELEEQVDRLKQKLLESEQTKGVLCEKCGWSMKFPDEDCRCELDEQVDQLKQKSIERGAMTEDEMAKEIAEMSDDEVRENVDRVFGDDLARRAVKCKAWRWMPGMRYVALSGYRHRVDDVAHAGGDTLSHDCMPDLTDPATLGCLLHLVREGWGDDGAHAKRVYRSGGYVEWICYAPSIRYPAKIAHGQSEAECLVAALESMNDD